MMDEFQNAFISYGRADSKAFAIQLHQHLTAQNLKVWFDQNDIPLAVDFQDQINTGIERSDNFLFIIAPHSVNSPYCLKEIELAIQLNKRIIPLLHVEQISYDTWRQRRPNDTEADWAAYQAKGLHTCFTNMHPAIARINWIYFREGLDDYDASLAGLLAVLAQHRDYVRQHTQLLNQALEWEHHQKQSRYLLVGEQRQQAEAWLRTQFAQEQAPCLPTDLHCEFITESIKNANNLMTQVFLAHAEEDSAAVHRVRCRLMREGFTVWTSKTDIQTGSAFQTAIHRGIEEADNMVYLLSPDALRSPYCQNELDYGLSLNKRIIPLLIRETNPSDIPPVLRGLQYIDLSDNGTAKDDQQDENQLIRILRQDADYYAEHKILLTKALKWERQNRNPSILLRGYNLRHSESWLKVAQQHPQHAPLPLQSEFITESLRQPPGGSLDVFVSYSRTDSDFARRLNDALQAQGKRTWFDQESIASGTDFQQEINRGIETSDHFLFILSPSAIQSPYCADEVNYARTLNKRIVTVLHRPIATAELHPALAAVQWIDFNQQAADFSTHFSQLLRVLDTDRDHLNTHTRLLVRAIEWDNAGRRDSLLLRGDELERSEEWLAQGQQKQPSPTELHTSYINTSRTAEDATQRATQILEAAAAKGKQRVLVGTTVMAIGLIVAGIAGAAAYWATGQATEARQQAMDARQQATEAQQQMRIAEQREKQAEARLAKATAAVKAAERKQQAAERQVKLAEQRLQTAAAKTTQAERQLQQAQRQVEIAQVNLKLAQVAQVEAQIAQKEAQTGTQLEQAGNVALQQFEVHQLDGLLTAMQAGQTLSALVKRRPLEGYPAFSPMLALQQILDEIQESSRVRLEKSRVLAVSLITTDRFATVEKNGTVRFWKANGQAESLSLGQDIESASFSRDGQRIAAIAADGMLRVWTREELAQKRPTRRPFKVREPGFFASVSFSPNGQQIATLSQGILQRWSLDGQRLGEIKTKGKNVSFSPDGQLVAIADREGKVGLWSLTDPNPQQPQEEFDTGQPIWSISFSPDGQRLAMGGQKGGVQLWSREGQKLGEFDTQQFVIAGLGFSPDGNHLAIAGSDRADGDTDHSRISLWNLTQRHLPELKTPQQSSPQRSILGVQFSADGGQLVAADGGDFVRVWSLKGRQLPALPVPQPNLSVAGQQVVVGVSLSRRGNMMAIVTDTGLVQRYDLTGKLLGQFQAGAAYSVDFSPDGQKLVTAGANGAILWSLTGTRLADIAPGDIKNASFSTSGTKILTVGAGTVAWRSLTGQPEMPFMAHEGRPLLAAAVSPDGQRFATSGDDGTVRLWTMANNLLAEYRLPGPGLSLSFSPDGQYVAVGDQEGSVRFIEVETLPSLLARGCRWLRDYPGGKETTATFCTARGSP